MGMTIWMHTLEGRAYSKDSDDHGSMCRYSDELDALSEQLEVKKLSAFFDYSDQELNSGDDGDDDDEDEEGSDPETGLAYGIDDMQWFDAAEGFATLSALRAAVAAGSPAELSPDARARLLKELDHCVSRIKGPAQRGGKFHLAVVD